MKKKEEKFLLYGLSKLGMLGMDRGGKGGGVEQEGRRGEGRTLDTFIPSLLALSVARPKWIRSPV